jgi:2-phosphosulfolactate phosphatase
VTGRTWGIARELHKFHVAIQGGRTTRLPTVSYLSLRISVKTAGKIGRAAALDRLCASLYYRRMSDRAGRQTVRIYPLPANIEPGTLAGGVAVVIDVLRASTTIIVALANGAVRVIPCGLVDTARRLAAEDETGNTLTGGERGGVKIEGFDLDNSPASYSPERVAGKTIAFTTTNGTAALLQTDGAARVLIGALVNRQAIVEALHADGRPVHLICAGTDGRMTSEDVFGAAAIAAGLARFDDVELWDEMTQSTAKHWPEGVPADRLVEWLDTSPGGSNLVALGFQDDIARAAQVDSISVVPEYSSFTRAITIGGDSGA